MSVSQHPIALRLERQVGEGVTLLATVMGLPLVDGIFPALLLAGAMDDPLGILEVGLLVFGGSATVAVVLADLDGSRRSQVAATLGVGVLVVTVAGIEAALAPTVQSLIDLETFQRFAGLVVLAVAAQTASARVGDYLPGPGVIIGLGLVASVDPANLSIAFATDPLVVARGVAAAAIGAGLAVGVALLGPELRGNVDLDRFRFGSAVALGVLGLSVLGIVPSSSPVALAVLGVAALLAFDPGVTTEATPEDPESSPTDGGLSDGERAPWL